MKTRSLALSMVVAALVGGAGTTPASARPSVSSANAKMSAQVRASYGTLTRYRTVYSKCKRRRNGDFNCLFGIHANGRDAIDDPSTRWRATGLGYLTLRHGRLVARILGPLSANDDFAPFR